MKVGNVCPVGAKHIAADPEAPEEERLNMTTTIGGNMYSIKFCKKCAAAFLIVEPIPQEPTT
jgi:hypothetical protein